MSENFYKILGINEKSTRDEIKKAYRTLQMKYHPDKNNNSQDAINMTQKINEAYETLGDEQKRHEYDMLRNNPNPFIRMNGGGGMEVPVDDIFNMFFGGGTPFGGPFGMAGGGGIFGMEGMPSGAKVHIFHGGPLGFQQALQKPTPIIKTININIEQVLSGTTMPLEIERWVLENGIKVFENETIYVTIPSGIDENEIIVMRDKGHVVNDSLKGDVKVAIQIENNTPFKRYGLDIAFKKTITLKEALCGFSFDIKHLNGKQL